MYDFKRTVQRATLIAACVFLAGCSTNDGRAMKSPLPGQSDSVQVATTVGESFTDGPAPMAVTGPWPSGSAIDNRYTCGGVGISPPLTWTPGPEDTQGYAIVIDNMDDPSVLPWVVTNIDFAVSTALEGQVPAGGVVAMSAKGDRAYDPPCPPTGSTHTFVVTVYALDALTPLDDNPDARTIISDIESGALEAATTVFTVAR
jgi:Raf kinase inhibitor-like YbhB/YbcL family protein